MNLERKPFTNIQALVEAVYLVRPPVLRTIEIDTSTDKPEVVRMEFSLTPELIKAWGEQCAGVLAREGDKAIDIKAETKKAAAAVDAALNEFHRLTGYRANVVSSWNDPRWNDESGNYVSVQVIGLEEES